MKRRLFRKAKVYEEKNIEVKQPTFDERLNIAKKLIDKYFPEQKGHKTNYKPIHLGYTNFSFLVTFENGAKYQVRIPHDGNIINRRNEYDILFKYLKTHDFIYFDKKTGIAIKKWLPGKCPSKRNIKNPKFLDMIFMQIKDLHKLQLKKQHNFAEIKFDAYNSNLYRLKFVYKKKFLCLIDRRRRDKLVLNHTDINPLNIIYNKEKDIATLIDYEWAGLTSDYFDYANFVRETGIKYKKIDWTKYIENFNMEIFEHYLFMVSMYSWLWTFAMPQTPKIIKYRFKVYKQIRKYYPAVVNVDRSCYIEHDPNEKRK